MAPSTAQKPAASGTPTTGEVVDGTAGALARRSPEQILAQFTELVTAIPEAPEDDGTGMIARLLEVDHWEDLTDEMALPSSKTLLGQEVYITGIWRKPSDKPSATGFYLMCERTDRRTGETSMFTAGGNQAVAVLAKLYLLDALPALVRFDPKATRSGNDAINCKVLDTFSSRAK